MSRPHGSGRSRVVGTPWTLVAARHAATYAGRPGAPDPTATIHINPLEVTRLALVHVQTKQHLGTKHHDLGRLLNGDWDHRFGGKRNPLLAEMPTHESVWLRYASGAAWEETPIFGLQLDRIRHTGAGDHGIKSRAELIDRYRRLDDTFYRLATSGYEVTAFEDAISVSIDRSGGFLLGHGGKHRLAMAQLLRLPTIEVFVLSRHARWHDIREAVANGSLSIRHPDLMGLGYGPSAAVRPDGRLGGHVSDPALTV